MAKLVIFFFVFMTGVILYAQFFYRRAPVGDGMPPVAVGDLARDRDVAAMLPGGGQPDATALADRFAALEGAVTAQASQAVDATRRFDDERAKGKVLTLTLASVRAKLQVDHERAAEATKEANERLVTERAKREGLAADLTATRERLAAAVREATAATAAREAAAADAEAKRKAEERRVAAVLAEKVRATEAVAGQAATLAQQLADEQATNRVLTADLASARERLERAAREASAADAKQGRVGATEIVAEQSAGQVAALAQRLAAEQARANGLTADLASTRERLDQAAREATTAGAAREAIEAAMADAESRRRAEHNRVAVLVERLSATEGVAEQAVTLGQRLAAEQARTKGLTADLAAARDRLARGAARGDAAQARLSIGDEAPPTGGRSKAHGSPTNAPTPTKEARAIEPPVQTGLSSAVAPPTGAAALKGTALKGTALRGTASPVVESAHVVLRYARDSAPARERAVALRTALRARGLDVSDPTGTPARAGDRVTYFYREDQDVADGLAEQLAMSGPTQAHIPAGSPPRPGTIEVTIGG